MEQQQSQASQNRFSFDEKPIGGGVKISQLQQYPPDFNPNQIEIENKPEPLPIAKRIQSKVYKVKKEALEELMQKCKQNVSQYNEFEPMTVKLITDSNPFCQQKALKIVQYVVENCGKNPFTSIQPKIMIKTLIQKCLVVEKGDIVATATQILFWFMDNFKNILICELNEQILNKNPKIVASSFIFLEKLVNNYGAKKLSNFEQFQKNFILLSDSVRPIAKKQSTSFFKEAYRWIADSLFSQYRIHPQVKEQVVKFSKTYTKEPMQIKRGLDELQKKGSKSCIQNQQQEQTNEPQDVLGPYDSRWVDKTLQINKWKQKKSVLDDFIKKTNFSTIVPRQNSHYITLIKRLLTQNNINLLQCGFKVVKNLCRGLKKNFSHPCKTFQSLVFSKLKDTKAMIVDQAQQTLQKMLYSITVEDLLDEIKQGLKDKAPNMRLQTLKFIDKLISVSKNSDKKLSNCLKILTITFVQMHQDGSSQVRDKSMDILCKIKGRYGINFFGDKLKKLPQKKLNSIQNYINPDSNEVSQMDIQQQQQMVINSLTSFNINQKVQKPGSLRLPDRGQKQQSQSFNNSQQIKQRKMTVISQPPPMNQFESQFESPTQSIRYNAYQQMLQKPANIIHQQLIQGFKNKVPMYRQSSLNLLKIIINLIKKAASIPKFNSVIGVQHLQLLAYHDWKKNRNMLTDFIQTNKISLSGLEYVKNQGMLSTQNLKKENISGNSNILYLKNLCNTIQTLLPKMSNPQFSQRLEAANKILSLIKQIPIGTAFADNQQIPDVMNQFYNVLKCRLQDSSNGNPNFQTVTIESVNKYIQIVTELMNKGIMSSKLLGINNSKNVARQIILILISKINQPNLISVQKFIRELIANHATLFFQLLPNQIIKDNLCGPILSIIRHYNQSFFKFADHKVYILPLLTCISMGTQTNKCVELLDQLVELNGQNLLQKIAKQAKLPNIQWYLSKWNITILLPKIQTCKASVNTNPPPSLISTNLCSYSSKNKMDRIDAQIQSPWPLMPSSSHILRLMNSLIALGDPFQLIASPIGLNSSQLEIINHFQDEFIENYSDLLIKWIFWRINIEHSHNNINVILNLARKIVTLPFQLHESQIIILMSSLEICLCLYNMLYISEVETINKLMSRNKIYKEKVFHFWVNVLINDQSTKGNSSQKIPSNQVLQIIRNCFEDLIVTEIVTLARLPCVLKNSEFIKYLKSKFSEKLLTVYGFKFNNEAVSQNAPSKLIHTRNIIPEKFNQTQESRYYLQFFQRSSSNQVVQKIMEHTERVPQNENIGIHIKIMWSIIPPYLAKQLPFINVYNYFRYLQKIIVNAQVGPYLLNLMKILCYFLIDVDEMREQSRSQMVKTINKLILLLLQIRDTKHIIEVLFLFYREQLLSSVYTRLNLLLPKCINKVLKGHNFKLQIQHHNPQYRQILQYTIDQIFGIFYEFQMTADSPVLKTLKNLLNDILTLYGNEVNENIMQYMNNEGISETIKIVLRQLFHQKSKQNNTFQTKNSNDQIKSNDETKYQFKQNKKSIANIIKAVGDATKAAENSMNQYANRNSYANHQEG